MIVNMQMKDNRYHHEKLASRNIQTGPINHEPQSMFHIANEFLSSLVNLIRSGHKPCETAVRDATTRYL